MRMGLYLSKDIYMCKECGNCSREHTRTIDDAVDEALDSPI